MATLKIEQGSKPISRMKTLGHFRKKYFFITDLLRN